MAHVEHKLRGPRLPIVLLDALSLQLEDALEPISASRRIPHQIYGQAVQMLSRYPFPINLIWIVHQFLNFRIYFLPKLAAIDKPRLIVVVQRNVARFPDFPAKDESCYVPSDLNNGLERPAHATALLGNRSGIISFVMMRFLRLSGHWCIP